MAAKWAAKMVLPLLILVLLSRISSSSASPPARMVASVVSNMVSNMASATFKWLLSLNTQPIKTTHVTSGRSMIKFESGYRVETVFDGGKIGIQPYSVQATPTGELIILDSANSNLHRVSVPLSRYSRPKLVAGTVDGYTGHVDGKLREARMYNPKSVAVDGKGNIYIADTMNMAIRKISDTGVITTIAGGRSSRGGGGHVDGPTEETKLSDDFEVVYVGSSCSLLVVDRGNQAIREIHLHFDDCTSLSSSSSSSAQQQQPKHHKEGEEEEEHGQIFDGNFLLGIAILSSVGFFGYMLALLHQRIKSLFSPRGDETVISPSQPPYTRPAKPLIPPLIPADELDDEEEEDSEQNGEFFLTSFFRLIFNAGSSVLDIFSGLLSIYATKRKKHRRTDSRPYHHHHQLYHPNRQVLAPDPSWPVHERYMIRSEEEQVPSLEPRSRPPSSSSSRQQGYPGFVGELDDDEVDRRLGERMNQEIRQRQSVQQQQGYDGTTTGSEIHLHQKQQKPKQQLLDGQIEQHQHHHPYQRHFVSKPAGKNSSSEKVSEQTSNQEILFGAVQEHHDMGMRREAVVIKAVDYSDPAAAAAAFNHHNIRPRVNYMGYSSSSSTNIY